MSDNLDLLISKAFEYSDSYIPYEEKTKKRHIFSKGYRKTVNKINDEFFAVNAPFETSSPRSKFRVRLAVICTLIFLAMLITGFIGYRYIAGMHVNEYNGYSVLTHTGTDINQDKEMKPFQIKGISKNDYIVSTECDIDIMKVQIYENKKSGNSVIISQYAISSCSTTRIDNEHAVTPLSSTFINGKEYAYTVYDKGECLYITVDGNSEISYRGNNHDEVIRFIKATVIA